MNILFTIAFINYQHSVNVPLFELAKIRKNTDWRAYYGKNNLAPPMQFVSIRQVALVPFLQHIYEYICCQENTVWHS
jgi:hypothetical protein